METNESILTREIVAIDDRKKLGKMKDLCVDCDTRAVSHYIVNSATTNSALVLPFERSIAVGDTFLVIQSRDDFLSTSADEAKNAINGGFRLIGVEVFSKAGNRLGTVESYEYDPVYGKVTKIILGKRNSFDAEAFIFFSPDFVFVDDGISTAYDLRSGTKGRRKSSAKAVSRPSRKRREEATKPVEEKPLPIAFGEQETAVAEDTVKEPFVESVTEKPVVGEAVEEPVAEVIVEKTATGAGEGAPAETEGAEEPVNDEDAVLKEFLIGAEVNDNVTSKDGEFKVRKGTKLTKELVDEAQQHDALLLLTMSVEA